MVFSRSSTAIWCVSRSESLDKEVRILCLSSTIARWDESEEDEDEDLDEGDGVGFVWFWGFGCFIAVKVNKMLCLS